MFVADHEDFCVLIVWGLRLFRCDQCPHWGVAAVTVRSFCNRQDRNLLLFLGLSSRPQALYLSDTSGLPAAVDRHGRCCKMEDEHDGSS